jgi:hypothetical protein
MTYNPTQIVWDFFLKKALKINDLQLAFNFLGAYSMHHAKRKGESLVKGHSCKQFVFAPLLRVFFSLSRS